MVARTALTELAWAGWRTRIPPDWRPLRIVGTWATGELTLGNALQTVAQISWERPEKERFDVERSLAAWVRRAVPKGSAEAEVRSSADFAASRCVTSGSAEVAQFFWCGYSRSAHLVVACCSRPGLDGSVARTVQGTVIPQLRVSARGEPVRWAVFNSTFTSPAGFVYQRHTLNAGNVGLEFRARGGRRLVVRQVYPADLALQRRALADWLDAPLFKDSLVAVVRSGPEALTVEAGGEALRGFIRAGDKRLPRLLRFVRCRRFVQAIVHDADRNRLRIAECEGRRGADEEIVREALAGMGTMVHG
jgi:hypothetical protein